MLQLYWEKRSCCGCGEGLFCKSPEFLCAVRRNKYIIFKIIKEEVETKEYYLEIWRLLSEETVKSWKDCLWEARIELGEV